MSLPPLVEPAAELTPDEVRRYSRHLIIPDVGTLGQRRLKNARVLVVGAGGLGSPTLLYLAAAGVGTIGIAEFDIVEESNLQRQVIHGQDDVGRPKAESARDSVLEVNPMVQVRLHQERLDRDNALRVVAAYDLVVDGTDNFATRYLLNDACALLGRPYVWASIFRFDGQTSVFWPAAPGGRAPCYRCLFRQPPPPGSVPSCAEGGVLGVLCATIGSFQATEAIKLVTGVGEPLVGRLLVYDALAGEVRTIPVRKDPGCPLCGERPSITELADYDALCGVPGEQTVTPGTTITVADLARMLEERERGDRDFLLVDVREPQEREINAIPGSVLVPKGDILDGPGLQRIADLAGARPVVLHCKTGVRSAEALEAVQRAGLEAVHVAGGVAAWVEQVDPGQPAY